MSIVLVGNCWWILLEDGRVMKISTLNFKHLVEGRKTLEEVGEILDDFTDIVSIKFTDNQQLFLDSSGNVFIGRDGNKIHIEMLKDVIQIEYSYGYKECNCIGLDKDGCFFVASGSSPDNINIYQRKLSTDIEIISIAAESRNMKVLDSDGNVWKLDRGSERRPVKLNFFNNIHITQIDCGIQHSAFLDSSGKVYTVGCNKYGQLGIGSYETKYSIIQVKDIINNGKSIPIPFICKINCLPSSTFLLDIQNYMYSCGNGTSGQLGHGNILHICSFKRIETLPEIITFTCYTYCVICESVDNSLWYFGALTYQYPHQQDIINPLKLPKECNFMATSKAINVKSARK